MSSYSATCDAVGNLPNWNGATFLHDSQGPLTNCWASSYAPKVHDFRRLRMGTNPDVEIGVGMIVTGENTVFCRYDSVDRLANVTRESVSQSAVFLFLRPQMSIA